MEEKLIEAVKRREVLYKKCSLLYRNKLKRAAAWNSIAKELDVPEIVCKSRWKSLRDRFVKKHTENYYTSGSGAEIEENQWQYYQQMEFLSEHIKPRKATASLTFQQTLHEQVRKKREISTDNKPNIGNDEIPSSDNTHTDNTENPEYNFLGKFEAPEEVRAEDTEYQAFNDDDFINSEKNNQMFNNNYEDALSEIEIENKIDIENQSISVSSDINSDRMCKKISPGTKKLEPFRNNEGCKSSNNANGIFSQRLVKNQNINYREEEQLLNFFRSCIDDILTLDKRKQRLFKKRVLDIIEELQDS